MTQIECITTKRDASEFKWIATNSMLTHFPFRLLNSRYLNSCVQFYGCGHKIQNDKSLWMGKRAESHSVIWFVRSERFKLHFINLFGWYTFQMPAHLNQHKMTQTHRRILSSSQTGMSHHVNVNGSITTISVTCKAHFSTPCLCILIKLIELIRI